MDKLSQHEEFAQSSKGISNNDIYNSILKEIKNISTDKASHLADVGCGEGHLLRRISKELPEVSLSGIDIVEYPENTSFEFIKQNFNEDFKVPGNKFDVVLAVEVIEHLENPRHFIRELKKVTKKGGKIIISTPNPYSLLSILSFSLKGFHSSFGPKNYPAHITEVSLYNLSNIINETADLTLEVTSFIPNGRIPGTRIHWKKIFPFIKGKRFSDNYYCVINKD